METNGGVATVGDRETGGENVGDGVSARQGSSVNEDAGRNLYLKSLAAGPFESGFSKESWEDYLARPGINPSLMAAGRKSMLSLFKYGGSEKETKGTLIGSMTHCLLLEPDKFSERYAIWTGARRQGNAYKEFVEENEGKDVVKSSEVDEAVKVWKAASRDYGDVFRNCNTEVSVFAEWQGFQCKGRIDALNADYIYDLKTTVSAEPEKFGKTFVNFQYGLKLGVYQQLAELVDGKAREVRVVAVEQKGDLDACGYDVPDAVLQAGVASAKRVMEDLVESLEREYWPGVNRGKRWLDLVVPMWAMPEEGILDWEE